jgi:hypothetical protein
MTIIFELTDDRGELVRLLADCAGMLREARAAGYPPPNWCMGGCTPRCWFHWGRNLLCSNCGSRVLPADQWHRLLTTALRACPQTWADWRQAA